MIVFAMKVKKSNNSNKNCNRVMSINRGQPKFQKKTTVNYWKSMDKHSLIKTFWKKTNKKYKGFNKGNSTNTMKDY